MATKYYTLLVLLPSIDEPRSHGFVSVCTDGGFLFPTHQSYGVHLHTYRHRTHERTYTR